MVTIDVQKRLIKMEVDDIEVQQRQQNWRPQKTTVWERIRLDVFQAHWAGTRGL